jgi:hypothetical protein
VIAVEVPVLAMTSLTCVMLLGLLACLVMVGAALLTVWGAGACTRGVGPSAVGGERDASTASCHPGRTGAVCGGSVAAVWAVLVCLGGLG